MLTIFSVPLRLGLLGVQSCQDDPKMFWLEITSNYSIFPPKKIPFGSQTSVVNLDQEFPETVYFVPFWPKVLF